MLRSGADAWGCFFTAHTLLEKKSRSIPTIYHNFAGETNSKVRHAFFTFSSLKLFRINGQLRAPGIVVVRSQVECFFLFDVLSMMSLVTYTEKNQMRIEISMSDLASFFIV